MLLYFFWHHYNVACVFFFSIEDVFNLWHAIHFHNLGRHFRHHSLLNPDFQAQSCFIKTNRLEEFGIVLLSFRLCILSLLLAKISTCPQINASKLSNTGFLLHIRHPFLNWYILLTLTFTSLNSSIITGTRTNIKLAIKLGDSLAKYIRISSIQ